MTGLAGTRFAAGTRLPVGSRWQVSVPATSANLGPGFDCFGLALELRDEVSVEVTGDDLRIEVSGAGSDTVPRDERHLVYRAMRAAVEDAGLHPPGVTMRCVNQIPQGRGLGSSAAAIVAGVLLGRAVAQAMTGETPVGESLNAGLSAGLSAGQSAAAGAAATGAAATGDAATGAAATGDDPTLELATSMEGHPDNVAACLFGGLTLAWIEDGQARASSLTPSRIRPAVFIPADQSSTVAARRALPRMVPHEDAAFNAARSALLVLALTGRPELLHTATADRLHQQYRAAEMPQSEELMQRLRKSGVAAMISGAGSSVLALLANSEPSISEFAPAGWEFRELTVAGGASIKAQK